MILKMDHKSVEAFEVETIFPDLSVKCYNMNEDGKIKVTSEEDEKKYKLTEPLRPTMATRSPS